jgi:hypothetical protein
MRTNGNTSDPWQRLRGRISDVVFDARYLCGDRGGNKNAPGVHERTVRYLEANVLGRPWADHLALLALIVSVHRNDVTSVNNMITCINVRFSILFSALGLTAMSEWKTEHHLGAYLTGELTTTDSMRMKLDFYHKLLSANKHTKKWLLKFSPTERERFKKYSLPPINPLHFDGLTNWGEVRRRQHKNRKSETDAVVPHLPDIRSEAHLRFNRMARLRQAYLSALAEIQEHGHPLPFEFSYEEGADPERGVEARERLHFRVWDRSSFVLAHKDDYGLTTVKYAKAHVLGYSVERNHTFLEFLRAEPLREGDTPAGFWFTELLQKGVVGNCYSDTTKEEQIRWLRAWGYGESGKGVTKPFRTGVPGLLAWNGVGGDGAFMRTIRTRGGIFIPVESLYAACMFALIAVDIVTTTGMRINELMQTRLDSNCLVRLVMTPPPEAKDRTQRIRYAFRLIPKGERTDTPSNYFIGKETVRLLKHAGHFLEEHYELDVSKGEKIPSIPFCEVHSRRHRFGEGRYVFQLNRKHLSNLDITACMRFLLHGMTFKTRDGKIVLVRSHLLRHAFATHAVQVAKVPIDVVGAMLKHKSLRVTEYYSQITEGLVAEAADEYLARIASTLDVKEAIVRSPEELQRQFEEAQRTVGTLTQVTGGDCTYHAPCYGRFVCVGCPSKVPNPAKRHQVEDKRKSAVDRRDRCLEEGLLPEAEQMNQVIRNCDAELREMEMIEAYRRDEARVTLIQIERRRQ